MNCVLDMDGLFTDEDLLELDNKQEELTSVNYANSAGTDALAYAGGAAAFGTL